jgi:dihydroflavonol-4-reductase
MKGTVLLTGGTGFVGSHLAEEMVRAGWRVRALVRKPDRLRWLAGIDAEIAKGDVQDPSSLPQALKGVDLVIHCAGLTKANTRREYMSANGDGTRALVQASIESGVRRFVFCSSQAAAGPSTSERPRVEEDPPEPLTDYGASKLEGEKAVREADGDLEWVVLRPSAIFGPRDSQFLPIFRTVTKLRRYPVFGSDERHYSWIYVRDFVAALTTVAEVEKGLDETYFVGSEQPTTWREVSQITASVRGIDIRPFPTIPLPVLKAAARLCEWAAQLQGQAALFNRQKLAEITAPGWVVSSEKIFRALGFRCQISLEDAVSETVGWYEEQGLL